MKLLCFTLIYYWINFIVSLKTKEEKKRKAQKVIKTKLIEGKSERNLSRSFRSAFVCVFVCNSRLFFNEMNFHLSLSISFLASFFPFLFNCNLQITFFSIENRLNWNWISKHLHIRHWIFLRLFNRFSLPHSVNFRVFGGWLGWENLSFHLIQL